jgi:excisionase family DNA binding protein
MNESIRQLLKAHQGRQNGVADANEMGAMLRISPRTVRSLANRKAIPVYRAGRAMRFPIREVLEALGNASQAPE